MYPKTDHEVWKDELERSRLKAERAAREAEYGVHPARTDLWWIVLLAISLLGLFMWADTLTQTIQHTNTVTTVNVKPQ